MSDDDDDAESPGELLDFFGAALDHEQIVVEKTCCLPGSILSGLYLCGCHVCQAE